ncbi:exonuclease domain-containing protein [Fontimonas sp. SYSU GA230001]|uniref:exonuclease domain-containing protein n=1 Tax=Fontimonas sp. SYSU GA230001 TaxID=3142450 RepID=UPI0032B3A8EC
MTTLAVALFAAATALVVAALLLVAIWPVELRPQLRDWVMQRGILIVLAMLLGLAAAMAAAWPSFTRLLGFVPRLAHDLDLLAGSRPDLRVSAEQGVPVELAAAVNRLAEQHARRRREQQAEIELTTQRLAEERDLLSAVLADVPAAVLACSREGRVLLYTPRAAELVRSVAPDAFLGLGRTVFALFRRSAVVHGLERMDLAVARGDARPASAALLPTRNGALLHARFTPLSGRSLNGFFVHLRAVEAATPAVAETGDSRRPLANLRAAVEMLRDFPSMADAERARFVEILEQESLRLIDVIGSADAGVERWPLEDIAADTLLVLLQSALRDAGTVATVVPAESPPLWVAVESFSLSALLRDFAAQLAPDRLTLALREQERHARLELRWRPARLLDGESWRRWEQAPLAAHAERLPLSPALIVRGHGGELWQQLDGDEAVLCVLLARAETPAGHEVVEAVRVEYAPAGVEVAGGEPPLSRLIYTAFDTETTGLDPAGGDRIIAIGGIRIVENRILSREVFETLVATERRIDPAAQRVHGIDAAMLAGQPPPEEALPLFRRYCEDTVLLGHNAAFDLRFFELQGQAAGVRFDLPVLDTLLLSQLVYPQRDAHRLEAIAERLGISVLGRHTALGDAILTAEVFLRLLPLLAARGIHTLSAALEASRRTEFARLKY